MGAGVVLLKVLLLGGTVLLGSSSAQRIRVRRQNMRVRINATGDTIVMKFLRPSPDVKLEGYILGYGSSMFSKQFITLPEDGTPYTTELDAEPKYLVAVQPIPVNDVKKHCTGKVNLEKPLHLVIGSVGPSAVLLSWGNSLKTPYEGNVMNECLEDGFYTIRYRERNRKWIYQTCPTSDTVIDNLKPNTPYEFGVRSNKDERSSSWSKSVVHSTNMDNKNVDKTHKLHNPLNKPLKPAAFFPPRPALHNNSRPRFPSLNKNTGFSGSSPRTSFVSPQSQQETLPLPGSSEPVFPRESIELGNSVKLDPRPDRPTAVLPKLRSSSAPQTSTPPSKLPANGGPLPVQPTKTPSRPERPENPEKSAAVVRTQDGSSPLLRSALANERANANPRASPWGHGSVRNLPLRPHYPAAPAVATPSRTGARNPLLSFSSGLRPAHPSSRSASSNPSSGKLGANGQPFRGISPPRPALWSRPRLANSSLDGRKFPGAFGRLSPGQDRFYGSPARPSINNRPNLVGKPGETDKINLFKPSDKLDILKLKVPAATTKPTKQERRRMFPALPTTPATRQESWEESDLFKAQPSSDVDAMGKKRYVAPHVVYQTGKQPDEPCSITSSLNYFPEDEPGEANVTSPPRNAPSNLTVVTVEGCPSFIILDWEKTDNDTTEYEVISTAKGPDGEQVSILITNQTHTAVENLKPESSYEFKVLPKNDLGSGPLSDPVSFNTESADPRVSENVSGKDAIWTQFPFKTDSYSDCHGKQFVKRTWYRKFVGVQLCNSLRYKIYLSDTLTGKFYNIGDQSGFGEDHCQFVDSFLDGRTGRQLSGDQLPSRAGFYRALRQEPVNFGQIGGRSHVSYVSWYECGTPIPGKW
ncbi:ABI family, member 3 (NESH) binding protein b [Cololabis saira]|uniref:ABI family, member 3 (NESH) binding protein b n=1 Tax=Cololabis saira TaxID=129043 RepID=UPI002AD2F78F|nr:ABI family, member 3 (NESH) binding protein b [Cololabis saira]